MRAMTSSQAHVGCLVLNVALGAEAHAVQHRIEEYLELNGPEWTCKRLKAINQVALLLKSGEKEKARSVLQGTSIAYHRNTLVPKGPEGIIVRHFLQAQRPSTVKRAHAALRFYTSLVLGELSPSQRDKALGAICGEDTSGRKPSETRALGHVDTDRTLQRRHKQVRGLDQFPIQSRERHCERLKATSKYYSRYKVPVGLRRTPYSSMAMSFMTEPWVPEEIDHTVPCFEMREFIRSTWSDENPQLFAGEITVIQEQGCKARVVCKPSSWLQLAFMPLHHRLASIAESVFPNESCVRDQVKGAYAILQHLQNGNHVYCTDRKSVV